MHNVDKYMYTCVCIKAAWKLKVHCRNESQSQHGSSKFIVETSHTVSTAGRTGCVVGENEERLAVLLPTEQ